VKSWEIWTYDPGFGDHPVVIISHGQRTANKPVVEFLLCSSQRAARPPSLTEVVLDGADGLSWETLCKCDLIRADDKSKLHTLRGEVTPGRRRQIVQAIIRSHGWNIL
jgi:mRNA-degrading endonuclease toxin of MazEF toxin-antitoxin module